VSQIHPSAKVHPSAVLEGDIELGPGVVIDALCFLRGPLVIGAGTRVYPHCVIGMEGEHRSKGPTGVIRIGEQNVIRELTVIQRGTGDRDTQIGDRCYLMDHVHVPHDCLIESDVTIAPNAGLGGHTHIHRGANLGIGCSLHQFSTVGAYAMVAMGAVITRDVPPFCIAAGNPARFLRLNTHPLRAKGWGEASVRAEGGKLIVDNPDLQPLVARFEGASRRARLELP
jgi:UDP-N-acetylglucosamine acyltransferase